MSAATFNQSGGALAIAGTYRQQGGGSFRFDGGAIAGGGTFALSGVSFFGAGTIAANVVSNSSQLNPGLSPGILNIVGSYAQDAASALNIEIAGPSPGAGHDQVNVTGVATLAGTLNVITAPTFCPQGEFTIMTYGSRSGDFAVKNGLQPAGGGSYEPLPGPATYVLKGTGCNEPPVANGDGYATGEDTTLDVPAPGVLANDTDAESHPLTAVLVAGPSHGSVTLNADGSFTYVPDADFNGTDSFTYKANDGASDSTAATVTVTVNALNDAPSFSKGADQTVNEDGGPQTVASWATAISAGPADEASQTVTFTVASDNPALFSAQPAVSAAGTLTYSPAPNATGVALVTVRLTDSGGTANGGVDTSAPQTVRITVVAVNDAPSFSKGADQTVNEDAGPQTVAGWATAISAGPADEASQTVTFTVSNDNPALFSAQPAVSAAGTLTYTPASNATGVALVTVRLTDSGGTANGGVDTSAPQTFRITVAAVNDAPSFTKGADQTVSEDAGPQTVASWATAISAGPADEASQTMTFTVANDNPALFSAQPAVSATGMLTYTPAPNANGVALVTVHLEDSGGTANGGVDTSGAQTFGITVLPVNDPPSFTIGADQTVAEDSGVQTVEAWATSIVAGPPDEAGQTMTFLVSNDNPAIFATPPAISPSGRLTYTPAADAHGWATVTVELRDSGGTANGGVDTGGPQTFVITVTPVNDVPVATDESAVTDEDVPTSITVTASDIDSASLGFSVVSGPGRGTLGEFGAVSCGPSEAGSVCSASLTYQPDPNASGTDSFTYRVDDGLGVSSIATVTITVNPVNDAAVANNQDVATAEDRSVVITLTGSDMDGDALQFTIAVAPSHGTLSGLTVTGPTTAEVVYTPDPDFWGSDSFNFVVNDGTVDSPAGSIWITVSALNDGPRANDQTAATDEDHPIGITLTGSDPEGAPLTFAIATPPASGVLDGLPPDVTYTPNANFSGTDTFTFTVSDGSLVSAPATVAITVNPVNDVPTATSFSASTVETMPVTLTLLGTDPEGDPVTFAIVAGSGPSNGTLGPVVGTTVTYTPDPGFTGLDGFRFTVSDGSLTSAEAAVWITVTSSQFRCPLTQGYWKTHPEAWPATYLTLGGQSYTKAALLMLLDTPVKGDTSLNLAHQLIAAKLNVASGADPAAIGATIAHADGLLSELGGKLPLGAKTAKSTRNAMVDDASVLDTYNNGQLTPSCTLR
ncbi:MAG: tandem-95 repeat protein [Candidatus Rokubacteria bacterium]|nr:tandem-95 repeat protein [Candidatus Rokubacteria bacterium]